MSAAASPAEHTPSPGGAGGREPQPRSGGHRRGVRRPRLRWNREWLALAAVLAVAAALRLIDLGAVAVDPFYDAAVRSMSLSWHNFFFGAFEPAGTVSIDKPPIDLWFQVASVKLFGFNSTTLKLPEAFGGVLAVGLLYAAIRRVWDFRAALGAALALALMPIETITSRSDTMDAVMMALLVAALLLLILACQSGRTVWLLAAAAVLGAAFNVKLLETVVALPGLAVIALLGFQRRARTLRAQPAGKTGEAARGGEPAERTDPPPAHPRVAAHARPAPHRGRRRVHRGVARLARRNAADPRARTPVGDRLDQRQRLERGVRVQRPRPHQRQVAGRRPVGLGDRQPSPAGDLGRARSDLHHTPLPHAPAQACRPALRRTPGDRGADRAAARPAGRAVGVARVGRR